MFHDPWCTFCSEFNEDFDKAAEIARRTNQPFILARVNGFDDGKDTCLKHSIEVEEYPVLKIFRMGIMSQDYSGPDSADGIAKFMQSRYGIASKELFTVAETEEFLKESKESTVLGFFEKGNDIETFFLKYAEHFTGDHRFGHSSAVEVISKYSEQNSIVFFRAPHFHNKFEPSSYTFKGDSQEELTKFLKRNRHGLVGHRKPDNVEDFDHPNVVVYYTVDYVTNAKQTNY